MLSPTYSRIAVSVLVATVLVGCATQFEGIGEAMGDIAVSLIPEPHPSLIHGEVYLAPQRYPPRGDSAQVRVIHGDSLTRDALEDVFATHDVLARFKVGSQGLDNPKCTSCRQVRERVGDEEYSRAVERQKSMILERAKERARTLGGDGVLRTRNSPLVAVIFRNARYAGPPDWEGEVMYVLRRKR